MHSPIHWFESEREGQRGPISDNCLHSCDNNPLGIVAGTSIDFLQSDAAERLAFGDCREYHSGIGTSNRPCCHGS